MNLNSENLEFCEYLKNKPYNNDRKPNVHIVGGAVAHHHSGGRLYNDICGFLNRASPRVKSFNPQKYTIYRVTFSILRCDDVAISFQHASSF